MARQRKPFDAVQFTRESAERIAGVVRAAETAAPSASPLTFEKRFPVKTSKTVRVGTFSGTWPVGSTKTVTFSNAPTATAAVINLTWPIDAEQIEGTPCVAGKDGTAWYLVCPRVFAKNVIVINSIVNGVIIDSVEELNVVTGVALSGGFDASNCSLDLDVTVRKEDIKYIGEWHRGPVVDTTAFASILTLYPQAN
jgi:hypothetical protein